MTTEIVRKPKFEYDIPFQKKILCLLKQEHSFATSVASVLSEDHFDKKIHRWLASEILKYAKRNNHSIPDDAVRIQAKHATRTGRLQPEDYERIKKILPSLSLPLKEQSFVKEELHGFVENQVWREFIIDSFDLLKKRKFEDIAQKARQALNIQFASTGGMGQSYVRDIDKRVKKRKQFELNGIPTGTSIDTYTRHGGLPPTKVGGIMAVYGAGKTHMLVHFGASAVTESTRDERVLMVILEGSEDDILDRYDAWFTKIRVNRLEKRPKEVRRKVRKLGRRYGDFLLVKKFPAKRLTISGLRAYLRQLETISFYPTLLLLDGPWLMLDENSVGRDESKYNTLSNVVQGLQSIAEEVKIPIWTTLQANRGSMSKEILDKDSIGDSWAAGQDLDVLLSFCQNQKEKQAQRARLFLAKSRIGPDGIEIPISTDWSRSRIRCLA